MSMHPIMSMYHNTASVFVIVMIAVELAKHTLWAVQI